MEAPLRALVEPALVAARAVLRDLESDQVPNDLRRVAGYGGRLPPPLQQALARALEQYEWLREKAAERLSCDRGDPPEASRLYLERPDGWGVRLADLAAERAAADAAGEAGSAAGERQSLVESLKASKQKMKAVRREAAAKVTEAEQRLAAVLAERKAEAAQGARHGQAIEQAVRAAEEEVRRLRGERDAAKHEVREARQALYEERSARRRAEAAAAGSAEGASWAGDPVELADRLDLTAAMSRPATRSSPPAGDAAPVVGRWAIPPQVHPDRREAIEWLLGTAGPGSVLVDGYNLGYSMPGERSPGAARSRVMALASRLHTMAGGRLRVTVVFDSSLGPAEEPAAPGPVAVAFSEAGETADDDIVRRSETLEAPVVVISNDRMVRERSERHGAVALWSRSLIDWATTR